MPASAGSRHHAARTKAASHHGAGWWPANNTGEVISSIALVAPLGIMFSNWSHFFRKKTTETIGSTKKAEDDADHQSDRHVLDQDSETHSDQGPQRDRGHTKNDRSPGFRLVQQKAPAVRQHERNRHQHPSGHAGDPIDHTEDQQSFRLAQQHPDPPGDRQIARGERAVSILTANCDDAYHHRQDPGQHISAVVDAADDPWISKRRARNARPVLQQGYDSGQRSVHSAEHEDADQYDPPQLGGSNPAQLRSQYTTHREPSSMAKNSCSRSRRSVTSSSTAIPEPNSAEPT